MKKVRLQRNTLRWSWSRKLVRNRNSRDTQGLAQPMSRRSTLTLTLLMSTALSPDLRGLGAVSTYTRHHSP
jgi:hypothetical protein